MKINPDSLWLYIVTGVGCLIAILLIIYVVFFDPSMR